ncbi:dihydropteroate synthase [Thermanaeromonas sp. C210]|uniref:dihydropteroate synthase n=1 Tax=Thermanaeromonas sp. C210 TaxID=2731925 RepID=UPI00155BEC4D|nr:dihydropteroate synthase [Thermanaeromonas sp. C210]GFN22420.1 dihydropteroate synthase [Thermanaeromonas sp. C210]
MRIDSLLLFNYHRFRPPGKEEARAGTKRCALGLGTALLQGFSYNGYEFTFGQRTYVMGILNVTPDSFSDGGLYFDLEKAVARAREMAAAGADIIDIGGESTRPGADPLPLDEELRRVIPVVDRLSRELSVPLSVDTYKAEVARAALEHGATIINDISGLRADPEMARVVADFGCPVVVMHIKGTPKNMQDNPTYEDVIGEVKDYLRQGVEMAVEAGLAREKVIVDPGIGFGKNLEHNLEILRRLEEFKDLGQPLLVGTSRKTFIGRILDLEPRERVWGTAATVALSIARGADIVRVHDVREMKQVVRMTDAIVRGKYDG